MRGRNFRPRAVRADISGFGTPLLQSLETPLQAMAKEQLSLNLSPTDSEGDVS